MVLNPQEPLPALRRAFMRVNPDYYTWSIEAQERYRVAMPEKDAFLIRQELFKALFGLRGVERGTGFSPPWVRRRRTSCSEQRAVARIRRG